MCASGEPEMKDRVGLGWRPQLAAGILANLDRIDIIEVIADDYFDASCKQLRALRTLATQVPAVLHGVSLGMASSVRVEDCRLEKMARLVEIVEPEFWSEHLAFVRGNGLEIGHLAAPPRTAATIEGAAEKLAVAARVVGAAPLVENVATLIDPPGSDRDEAAWVSSIISASGCALLLDLHNLYCNAINFGLDPMKLLKCLPLESVRAVHLAGGKWVCTATARKGRLLDDHLHDVPDPVYKLLVEVGAFVPHSLTVILERDGRFPPFGSLLQEMERAREALARGRALQASGKRMEDVA